MTDSVGECRVVNLIRTSCERRYGREAACLHAELVEAQFRIKAASSQTQDRELETQRIFPKFQLAGQADELSCEPINNNTWKSPAPAMQGFALACLFMVNNSAEFKPETKRNKRPFLCRGFSLFPFRYPVFPHSSMGASLRSLSKEEGVSNVDGIQSFLLLSRLFECVH